MNGIFERTPTSRAKPAGVTGCEIWVKASADGLVVESQRGAEVTWTVVGTDNFSPYLDGRDPLVAGQPEVRRYRGRYVLNDEPVGNYSAVASVTTIP